MKQSGGDLWVYSEPAKGTAFKLYFPRLEADAVAYQAPVSEGRTLVGTETVLLVEDDEAVRELARKILVGSGYNVLVARNGLEALELCEGRSECTDLVVTDMVMPELGGTAMVGYLSDLCPEVKVLYMSGYTDDDVFRRGDVENGMPFIQKPFTLLALSSKVRLVLDSPSRTRVS